MEPATKRRLTFVTIGLFFALSGVEYAVILPTAWLYISRRYGAETYVFGIVMAAFSLSGLVAGPAMGRWSDRTGNTKAVFLVANLFEIAGSLMYFAGVNKWFIVLSRLVAGIGTGVGPALFGDITRVTTTAERTGVMSLFMAVRQIGMLAGPACNLFLRQLNFKLLGRQVDAYTAPGLFMAMMWCIMELLVIFLFWNLPRLQVQEEIAEQHVNVQYDSLAESNNPVSQTDGSINNFTPTTPLSSRRQPSSPVIPAGRRFLDGSDFSYLTSSSEMIENAENFMGRTEQGSIAEVPRVEYDSVLQNSSPVVVAPAVRGTAVPRRGYGTLFPADDTDTPAADCEAVSPPGDEADGDPSADAVPARLTCSFLYTEFIREEVVVLLATVFVALFNQVSLETMVTPLTEKLLDWEELENSIFYTVAAAEIILAFMFIRWLSRHMADRGILLIGFTVLTASLSFYVWFIPIAPPHEPGRNMWGIIVGSLFYLLSIAFVSVSSASLYSKITSKENQGFNQGIRRVFLGMGTILGPLWAGSLLDSGHMYIMLGVMLAINCVVMVMLLLSFKHLKEPDIPTSPSSHRSNSVTDVINEETQPLL